MVEFFDRLIGELRADGRGFGVEGISAEEIDNIRADQGVDVLPDYYREFLNRAGRSAGQLLIGTDAFYPRLLGIRSDAIDLLLENDVLHLMGNDAVVFAMHQGYQVYWLESSVKPNPAVAMYQEGDRDIRNHWSSFSEFLDDQTARDIAVGR